MMLHSKLNEAITIEKLNITVPQNLSWMVLENMLKHRQLEKYSLWLTTGKIIPEAGQISPAIAHSGHTPII